MAKTEPIRLKFQDGDPFANSQYYKYGDYDLHYRIDPAKGKEKVAVNASPFCGWKVPVTERASTRDTG